MALGVDVVAVPRALLAIVAWLPITPSPMVPGIALDGGHVLSGVAGAKRMHQSFALMAALPLGGLQSPGSLRAQVISEQVGRGRLQG